MILSIVAMKSVFELLCVTKLVIDVLVKEILFDIAEVYRKQHQALDLCVCTLSPLTSASTSTKEFFETIAWIFFPLIFMRLTEPCISSTVSLPPVYIQLSALPPFRLDSLTIVSQTIIVLSSEAETRSLVVRNSSSLMSAVCALYTDVSSPDLMFHAQISPSAKPPYTEFSLKLTALNCRGGGRRIGNQSSIQYFPSYADCFGLTCGDDCILAVLLLLFFLLLLIPLITACSNSFLYRVIVLTD